MKQNRKRRSLCLAVFLTLGTIPAHAQQQPSNEREVSLKRIVPNILEDQKAI
jgi:hypothetical protein